jgi:hypothetical protein
MSALPCCSSTMRAAITAALVAAVSAMLCAWGASAADIQGHWVFPLAFTGSCGGTALSSYARWLRSAASPCDLPMLRFVAVAGIGDSAAAYVSAVGMAMASGRALVVDWTVARGSVFADDVLDTPVVDDLATAEHVGGDVCEPLSDSGNLRSVLESAAAVKGQHRLWPQMAWNRLECSAPGSPASDVMELRGMVSLHHPVLAETRASAIRAWRLAKSQGLPLLEALAGEEEPSEADIEQAYMSGLPNGERLFPRFLVPSERIRGILEPLMGLLGRREVLGVHVRTGAVDGPANVRFLSPDDFETFARCTKRISSVMAKERNRPPLVVLASDDQVAAETVRAAVPSTEVVFVPGPIVHVQQFSMGSRRKDVGPDGRESALVGTGVVGAAAIESGRRMHQVAEVLAAARGGEVEEVRGTLKAWTDLFLLGMSHRLLSTANSLFSSAAAGLAGLEPPELWKPSGTWYRVSDSRCDQPGAYYGCVEPRVPSICTKEHDEL